MRLPIGCFRGTSTISAASTLAQYSPAYFERAEAAAYIGVNPGWRDNGRNAGFWFRFTPANLARLASTIVRKR